MTTVSIEILEDPARKNTWIKVEFEYEPTYVTSIKTISGAKFVGKDKGGPYWIVPLDLDVCHMLREKFGKALKLGPNLRRWAVKEKESVSVLTTLATSDSAELEFLPAKLPDLYKFMSSRPYQLADVAFMSKAPSSANANQPGLGKTVEAIASVFESNMENGFQLVVAPVTSLDVVWEYELLRWDDAPVYVAPPGKEARQAMMAEIMELYEDDPTDRVWVVINPAMVQYRNATKKTPPDNILIKGDDVFEVSYPELFQIEWNTLILDEFHKCGLTNTSTLTSKAMGDVKAKKKIGLSGTPMGGKPIKLFGLLNFLYPEDFSSKWRFADQWLVVEDNGYGKVIHGLRKDREQAFFQMLTRYMVRRTKAEVLKQLPPKQFVDIWVHLEGEQLKQYKQFEKAAAIKIADLELSATSILAEYTRLKQFANAKCDIKKKLVERRDAPGVLMEQLHLIPLPDSAKLPQVERLLNELGIDPEDPDGDEQVVIFSQFSAMVDMVHAHLKKLGYPVEKLTGETTQAKRTDLVRRFQGDDSLRVLVMTTTAGGVSITLDKASTVIFLDETWVPDDQEQAADRVHRGSRIHQVTIYKIRAANTIEEYIDQTNVGKQDINDLVLDIRRRLLKETGDE